MSSRTLQDTINGAGAPDGGARGAAPHRDRRLEAEPALTTAASRIEASRAPGPVGGIRKRRHEDALSVSLPTNPRLMNRVNP